MLFWSFYTEPVTTEDGADPIRRYGLCGDGGSYQARIMEAHSESVEEPHFTVLSTPPEGRPGHWSELAELARETNEFFDERARRILSAKREKTGLHDLELTIALGRKGLNLVYVMPAKRKKGEFPRRSEVKSPRSVRGKALKRGKAPPRGAKRSSPRRAR